MTRTLHRASRRLLVAAGPVLVALSPFAAQLAAQQPEAAKALLAQERYVTPPAEVARLVTAPRHLNSTLSQQSPDKRHFLVLHGEGLGDSRKFAKPHVYLGGLQVDLRANRVRSLTTRGTASMEIVNAETGARSRVEMPAGATASSPSWSPDGAWVAFLAHGDDASHVYVADARTGKSRRLTSRAAMPVLNTSLDWAPDGSAVYAVLIPESRMAEPREPAVAEGPVVRLTGGAKNKTRTYASLLETPHHKAQLEYYTTSQLARIDARSGAVRNVGAPAMIQGVEPSPDGAHLRVTLLQKPFSYIVPVSSFGTQEQLWTTDGRLVTVLARRALRESDMGDNAAGGGASADTGKRAFAWMPDGRLAYLMQEPAPRRGRGADSSAASSAAPAAGDTAAGPRRKDRLYAWSAPFSATSSVPVVESDNRIAGFVFTTDGKTVVLSEQAGQVAHTYAVSLAAPGTKRTIYRARGAQVGFGGGGGGGGGARGGPDDSDFYNNPGTVVLRQTPAGNRALVSTDGGAVYLEGTRYLRDPMKAAPRMFVDRVELATGAKSRLFEGDTTMYESNPTPIDDDYARFVVTRESPTAVPDQFLRERASGRLVRLTENKDVTPEVTRMPRRQIQVTRADGYKFWVNVTLPVGYREGTRLPAMFWFYPYEYPDQDSYDRTKRTLNRLRYPAAAPRSMEIMATQGYAVVQPDLPIFGTAGRLNDNYQMDLRNGLTAVIDELDRQGLIDRQRLGLGGHSYGAFSTVNAMVNMPYFKAGIAGDGNYNRSLTPNGFQSERRDLWEARDTYMEMSPLLYADRLQGALLMYHSIDDQNVGTAPENSERLFHALQGMGKTASLYMYPYEDHGPLMEQTLLDQWGRWVAWLDLHVKNAGKKDEKIALVP